MSQTENSLPDGAADSVTKVLKDIEEEIDFKSYLDAVNAGSNRTRSTVYVLVAMVVIIFTGYRNTTMPDWLDQRLGKFQLASACVKENSATDECITNNPSQSDECTEALGYAKHFLFSDEKNPLLGKREFCSELNDQMVALMKLRTEALSIRLPFFGMVIDVNDLALISNLFLAFILYVLYVGIDRETDNLDRAIGRAKGAKTEERQKDNLELLLMTQVLASKKGATYGVHIVLLFVVIVCGFVFWDDLMTYHTAVELLGRFRGVLENVFVVIVFLVVVVLCVFVWIKQRRLDVKVDYLILDLRKLEARLLAGGTGGDRLIAS
jgi:hypothetical protein